MIKVSIIIPTYKGEDNIMIAVKSALNINEEDKEIIVIDDNGIGTLSQKKTYNKLYSLIKENKIIYKAHKINKNGSSARNTGFNISKGKYIVFLDDDDYLYPQKIKIQIKQLERKGKEYGLSITGGYYVRDDGRGYKRLLKENRNFLLSYLLDKNYFNTSALLIRREVVKQLQGFDENFVRHQDWEFCVRMFTITKVCFISYPYLIKYSKNRNIPKNLLKQEENLDYFFEKIDRTLQKKLSVSEILKIKKYKYRQIFNIYILTGQFLEGIKYIKRKKLSIGDILLSGIEVIRFVFQRLFYGTKKQVFSTKEISNFLGIK